MGEEEPPAWLRAKVLPERLIGMCVTQVGEPEPQSFQTDRPQHPSLWTKLPSLLWMAERPSVRLGFLAPGREVSMPLDA